MRTGYVGGVRVLVVEDERPIADAIARGLRRAGMAVDVGSTTVAGHLCDLATGEVVASTGIMNPQIRFGEDLMSRVSYVMMHDDGARELTAAIRTGLREVLGQLVAAADVEHADFDHGAHR